MQRTVTVMGAAGSVSLMMDPMDSYSGGELCHSRWVSPAAQGAETKLQLSVRRCIIPRTSSTEGRAAFGSTARCVSRAGARWKECLPSSGGSQPPMAPLGSPGAPRLVQGPGEGQQADTRTQAGLTPAASSTPTPPRPPPPIPYSHARVPQHEYTDGLPPLPLYF